MAAYLIFIRDGAVFDPAEMATYARKNREAGGGGHALKPIAVYGAMETLEGAAADGVVLLEFPTIAEAKAWYSSPAYQDAAAHRKRASNYRVIMVEGVAAAERG